LSLVLPHAVLKIRRITGIQSLASPTTEWTRVLCLAYLPRMVRHRGRYTHSPFRSGWVVTRDLVRTVLEAIDCTQGNAQEGFASRRARLVGEGWAAEGKAAAGDLEFFNKAGARIAVTIEPDDPRLPPQRMYGPSD
jgi:hypothetical protein